MKTSKKTRIIQAVLATVPVLALILGAACSPASAPTPTPPAPTLPVTPTTPATPSPTPVPGPAPSPGRPPYPSPSTPAMPASPSTPPPPSPSFGGGGNIGLAAGGAKDVNNFRENIMQGYLPLPTDVTYEGLFYDYFFDTGIPEGTNKLFSPAYSYAVSEDPFSGQTDYYLSVGLTSGMKERDFERKKLNLVVVLDISGSMGASFDTYYYDRFGRPVRIPGEEASKSKMQIANESVVALLSHLEDDDRFGMVVFDDTASVLTPLRLVGRSDMGDIKNEILRLRDRGGTNLDAGIKAGTDLFDDRELRGVDPDVYENRIIFLSDAMPNLGDTSQRGLLNTVKRNAGDGIYASFIGVGLDFNSELVEHITKIRGANYYSVHSSSEFRQRLYDEFDYMVTPLVFDLRLTLESTGWEIQKVYGTPEAGQATGELMRVNTLFPSKSEGGETKGGLILLKLRKTGTSGRVILTASYEDRNGRPDSSETLIRLDGERPEYFENSGVRKGVLLARYADLLKDWMIDERRHFRVTGAWEPMVDDRRGIIVPPMLSQWERQSMSLRVSGPYPTLFAEFLSYFRDEMDALNDDTLEQEVDILRELSRSARQVGYAR